MGGERAAERNKRVFAAMRAKSAAARSGGGGRAHFEKRRIFSFFIRTFVLLKKEKRAFMRLLRGKNEKALELFLICIKTLSL